MNRQLVSADDAGAVTRVWKSFFNLSNTLNEVQGISIAKVKRGQRFQRFSTLTDGVPVVNVTFEPGCRNNWHVHKATKGGGQTLVCVGGRGYYQEWGKEPVELRSGDAINIPAGVKHWHGAAPDSWFSHLAIGVPGENNSTEWLEPVGDEEYSKLK